MLTLENQRAKITILILDAVVTETIPRTEDGYIIMIRN